MSKQPWTAEHVDAIAAAQAACIEDISVGSVPSIIVTENLPNRTSYGRPRVIHAKVNYDAEGPFLADAIDGTRITLPPGDWYISNRELVAQNIETEDTPDEGDPLPVAPPRHKPPMQRYAEREAARTRCGYRWTPPLPGFIQPPDAPVMPTVATRCVLDANHEGPCKWARYK